jgi:hypothetical protein
MEKEKLVIEIQHFHGCPNSPRIIERVKEAIKDFDEPIIYREVLAESNEQAAKIHFRGSPTLLINGNDFENLQAPENPALTCRYYQKGLPTTEQIKNVLISFKRVIILFPLALQYKL